MLLVIIIYPNYYVPPSSTHLSQRVQINPLEHLSVKWLGSVSVGKNAEQTLCSLECSLYRSSRASGLCSIFLIEYLSRVIAFNFQLNCLQKQQEFLLLTSTVTSWLLRPDSIELVFGMSFVLGGCHLFRGCCEFGTSMEITSMVSCGKYGFFVSAVMLNCVTTYNLEIVSNHFIIITFASLTWNYIIFYKHCSWNSTVPVKI